MRGIQPVVSTYSAHGEARATAESKNSLKAVARVRIEPFAEGRVAQVMHIGPYAAEGPTIDHLHAFIGEHGYRPAGRHHEIYLSDPRRSAPERMKTVIRQPIVEAGAAG